MDKRLAKRHKRQVARAKGKVKLSEPDLRTSAQIEAAKEAGRPEASRGNKVVQAWRTFRNKLSTATGKKDTDA